MKELQFFLLNSHYSAKEFSEYAHMNYNDVIRIKNGGKCSENTKQKILDTIDFLES